MSAPRRLAKWVRQNGSGVAAERIADELDLIADERDAIAAATGTAKTPQAVECEASQSGGAAASPNPSHRSTGE